jgi:signal transduction histidine kinase
MDEQAQNGGNLLVVGQDAASAEFLADALGNDCRIRFVENVRDAVACVSDDPPDLVIADLVADELQKLRRSLDENAEINRPFLVLLIGSASDKLQGVDADVLDCLSRDANADLIRLRIKRLLEWKRTVEYVDQFEIGTHTRVEQLESLIEMVAHDLKSPVIAIQGFVVMLRKRCGNMPPDPKLDEILKHLSAASCSLQNFLSDLSQLLAADGIELELEEVCLTEAIEEVVGQQLQALEEKRMTVNLDFADYRPTVLADKRRIMQVLDNLIVNAISHMGRPARPRVDVRLRDSRRFVITSVCDNGVGIPPEYHDQVFKRFFRVPGGCAKTGTGLGLSIAKTIVETHSGRIWLESDAGKGATFSFTLPKFVGDKSECKPAQKTVVQARLSRC